MIARISLGISFRAAAWAGSAETLASHVTCAVSSVGAAAASFESLFQLVDLDVDLADLLADLRRGQRGSQATRRADRCLPSG